jgi:hypothetical protein
VICAVVLDKFTCELEGTYGTCMWFFRLCLSTCESNSDESWSDTCAIQVMLNPKVVLK